MPQEEEIPGEGATSPEPVTREEKEQTAPETAAEPVPSPADFLPAPEAIKNFIIPQDIVIKIAGALASIPDFDAAGRVQAFNEILSLMQSRFKLKLDAEPMLVNGMIFARPTVLLGEDIEAEKAKMAKKAMGEAAPVSENNTAPKATEAA